METIDLTPTWAEILPVLLAVLESSDFEGRKVALGELRRMAQAADQLNIELRTIAEHDLSPSAETVRLRGGQ